MNFISSLSPSLQTRQGKKIDTEVVNLPAEIFGRPKAPAGTWGSSIRIIDPIEAKTIAVIPLEDNEAAFSLAVVPFSARGGELHLVVGTAADTLISPRTCSTGYLRTYTFTNGGAELEFQHKVCSFYTSFAYGLHMIFLFLKKTEVDDVPLALLAFQGRLVAGVGKALRIYDIGKKKLLRKVENKVRLFRFK